MSLNDNLSTDCGRMRRNADKIAVDECVKQIFGDGTEGQWFGQQVNRLIFSTREANINVDSCTFVESMSTLIALALTGNGAFSASEMEYGVMEGMRNELMKGLKKEVTKIVKSLDAGDGLTDIGTDAYKNHIDHTYGPIGMRLHDDVWNPHQF